MAPEPSHWAITDTQELIRRRNQAETYHHLMAGDACELKILQGWGLGMFWNSVFALIILIGLQHIEIPTGTSTTLELNWPIIVKILQALVVFVVIRFFVKVGFLFHVDEALIKNPEKEWSRARAHDE